MSIDIVERGRSRSEYRADGGKLCVLNRSDLWHPELYHVCRKHRALIHTAAVERSSIRPGQAR